MKKQILEAISNILDEWLEWPKDVQTAMAEEFHINAGRPPYLYSLIPRPREPNEEYVLEVSDNDISVKENFADAFNPQNFYSKRELQTWVKLLRKQADLLEKEANTRKSKL